MRKAEQRMLVLPTSLSMRHSTFSLPPSTFSLPPSAFSLPDEGPNHGAGLVGAQQAIAWAEHLVFFFPLWLGGMPALLKGFLERVARPGFALGEPGGLAHLPQKLLAGRSARLVVTMGMPALAYRWIYRAHSLKALSAISSASSASRRSTRR